MDSKNEQARNGYRLASMIYDPVIERTMAPVRQKTIEISGLQPGQTALDLCCGTGGLAQLIARTGAIACGVELSDYMFRRAKMKETPGLSFIQADAAATGLPESSFDITFTGFSLHEVDANTRAGFLAEMRRVTKPGGFLVFTDFSTQTRRKLKNKLRKGIADTIERIAGGEHFGNYAEWMQTGGLEEFLTANDLPPASTIPLNGGHILIAKSLNVK